MIGYVTLGTNDLPKAVAFYDALLSELGAARFMQEDSFFASAIAPDKPALSVCKPHDGNAAYFRDLDGNKLNAFYMHTAEG